MRVADAERLVNLLTVCHLHLLVLLLLRRPVGNAEEVTGSIRVMLQELTAHDRLPAWAQQMMKIVLTVIRISQEGGCLTCANTVRRRLRVLRRRRNPGPMWTVTDGLGAPH